MNPNLITRRTAIEDLCKGFVLLASGLYAARGATPQQEIVILNRPKTVATATPFVPLIDETFETGTRPSPWFNSNGTPVWNAAGLDGTYALSIDASAATVSCYAAISAQAEVYVRCLFKPVALPSATRAIFRFFNNTTSVAEVAITSTGALSVLPLGGSTQVTTGTMSVDSVYYLWFHYRKATSNDGFLSAEFETGTPELGSGNNFKSSSNGTSTDTFNRLSPYCFFSTSGANIVIDDFKAATSQIPS